ncbi:hypothetical protein BFP76_13575 [Amylibacter kogurei]|uniref:DUF445 domain-containing protein n=1 Tax=Paramylibacter kogurei TaxID=1889778 RepID=A0A2G5KAD3_9RHOB|nr:DUF445 domain-containing protein [Amylibacter kogurei]PIB26002.1 hypothetical protein BFP76_13575 [Amylibacter kogurei]
MPRSVSTEFRRNKAIATGLLLITTAIFVATLFVPSPSNWVLFIQAVAEAGMIGGLADWFAVEALFRHPLGIPVPHTALLPKSKNRVAKNVGDFITKHFLKPDLIREKLFDMNVGAAVKDWLLVPSNTQLISQKAAIVLKSNLHETGPSEPPAFFKLMLRSLLMRPQREAFFNRMITKLMASDLRDDVIDYGLIAVKTLIDDSRDSVTKLVQDRSRWWIASTADRRFSQMLIDEMIKMIDELLDHKSELRAQFDNAMTGFTTDPKQSANIGRTVQGVLLQLVDSDEFDEIVATFIRGLKRSLDEDLQNDIGHTTGFIENTLLSVAQKLDANPDDLAILNQELSNGAGEFVERLSASASEFIASTIKTWDEAEMVELFESQVGSDLQFIRMNGTLLGGLIGGVLFFLSEALKHFM